MKIIQKAAFLSLLPKMRRIDCVQAARIFNKTFDTNINHHEFAYYLDELAQKGILRITGYGEATQYALNTDKEPISGS